MDNKKPLLALALMCAAGLTQAGEKEELLKLRNTTTNLIKQLVKQGVITDKTAEDMIKQAEADADQQVAEAKAAAGKEAAPGKEAVPADEVRVTYVPDFVKDEIRQQVRSELREEVVGDVMQKAKKEQWGMPNALPEWTRKFKLSGDLRLREQSEYMPKDNTQGYYKDWQAINDRGGEEAAINNNEEFVNVNNDRHRLRQRLRLGIDAQVTDGLVAGIRLSTGNQRDPVSTNQTLGNNGQRYEFTVDRAFLKYDLVDDNKFNWLTLSGGRIKNPWYTGGDEFTGGSEVVWDTDLSFEGVAATVRHHFGDSDNLGSIVGRGPSVFATAGAFPLQESVFSKSDKWLFGGQAGLDWGFANQDSLKFGVGYFDFSGIQAKPNTNSANYNICNFNTPDNSFSKPEFMQLGNSLATICANGLNNAGTNNDGLVGLIGLASDYNILNINAAYDLAMFAPHHLKLSADYAKNLGFNLKDIQRRYGNFLSMGGNESKPQTSAWQVRADLGWPRVDVAGNWSVFTLYKHLERDAVLDAYTDSDFHLGGTNTKGWVIGANYGLVKNVWLTGRWLSADVITGPRYGVDILQVDVNTRF